MSSFEYIDFFVKAQQSPKALYHIIAFDVVDSKKIVGEESVILHNNLFKIAKNVYDELLDKERLEDKQILLKDSPFFRFPPYKAGQKYFLLIHGYLEIVCNLRSLEIVFQLKNLYNYFINIKMSLE